jgi:hypothetical protein
MDDGGDKQRTGDDLGGREAFGGAFGERCSDCGAPLASDQRYCIECGQRRGKPRFSVASPSTTVAPPKRERRRLPRPSGPAGATLVAGVATLLLAMGVGFEIGHSNAATNKTTAAAPPEVITVNGGGGSSGTATTASTNNATSSKKTKTPKAHKETKVVVQKANDAASKALGTSSKNLASNPTVQQGQSCTGGAGCQGGKFTGNFFGP